MEDLFNEYNVPNETGREIQQKTKEFIKQLVDEYDDKHDIRQIIELVMDEIHVKKCEYLLISGYLKRKKCHGSICRTCKIPV